MKKRNIFLKRNIKLPKFNLTYKLNWKLWPARKLKSLKRRKWKKLYIGETIKKLSNKKPRAMTFRFFKTYKLRVHNIFRRFFAPHLKTHQFTKIFKKNIRYKTILRNVLKTEQRIDNIVFRIFFLKSLNNSKELISHGFFSSNGLIVLKPNFVIKPGSIISPSNQTSWIILFNITISSISTLKKYYSRIFFKFNFPLIPKKKIRRFQEYGRFIEKIKSLLYEKHRILLKTRNLKNKEERNRRVYDSQTSLSPIKLFRITDPRRKNLKRNNQKPSIFKRFKRLRKGGEFLFYNRNYGFKKNKKDINKQRFFLTSFHSCVYIPLKYQKKKKSIEVARILLKRKKYRFKGYWDPKNLPRSKFFRKRITKQISILFQYRLIFNNSYKLFKEDLLKWKNLDKSYVLKNYKIFDKKKIFNKTKPYFLIKPQLELKNKFFFLKKKTVNLHFLSEFDRKKIIRRKKKYLKIKGLYRSYKNFIISFYVQPLFKRYNSINILYKKLNLIYKHRPFPLYYIESNYKTLEFFILNNPDFYTFPYRANKIDFKLFAYINCNQFE